MSMWPQVSIMFVKLVTWNLDEFFYKVMSCITVVSLAQTLLIYFY